ncbi:DNA repair protein RecN [Peptoclostridium acidaminophilum DSM 3953]|uniref:DNA repair protein RecN n=1 Tax=Peptoclostridium acidaminophilum DSM 3953 TaxID=1286171 RepID=W8TJW1_PEPAC|nr:DNA repair protein RecN [Peptoclostridium acidaminophilum]AHM56502.1 DNA repair protein RecN [Peptoclostridium acidaminophilum DSM 3953]
MILELYVKNFILIDETRLRFENGLNILTGETGSGKSIILNALQLCMGEKWDKDYIRRGEKGSVVEATFHIEGMQLREEFSEMGFDCLDDGIVIITREIMADGKSISRINGRNVKVGLLRQMSGMIIDIHSQHESQELFNKERYVGYLDRYAGKQLAEVLYSYKRLYSEYRDIKGQISELAQGANELQAQRDMDLLRFQIKEIEDARIDKEELEQIEKELDMARNIENIQKKLTGCYSALYASEYNITDMISAVMRDMSEISDYDAKLGGFAASIEDVYYRIGDLSKDIRRYSEGISLDEERLSELDSRISEINNLKRKYGNTADEIINYLEEIRQRLSELENRDELSERLRLELTLKTEQLEELALVLSGLRKKAAEDFAHKLRMEYESLNSSYIDFAIEFSRKELLSETGRDDVAFMVSFNQGEKRMPVYKVASGGEISRFMLTLKNITTQFEPVETLVFDEIDTGISGIAAQVVGNKLKDISRIKQVICITHLPQIAVNSDAHFSIEKVAIGDAVVTRIEKLSLDGKINEIARLIGGMNITKTTLQNAKEILGVALDSQEAENGDNK